MGKIIKNGVLYGGNNTITLTQEEYDTLTQAQKENGTIYFVTDGVPTPSNLADYVVEQGTSGIWTYRKWNSGVAECWGYSSTSISISGNGVASFGTLNFPTSLFVTKPILNVSGGGYAQPSVAPFYSESSATSTDIWFFNRASGAFSNTAFVHCHAIGTWK